MDGLSELVATLTGLDLYSIGVRWIDGLLQGVKQGWQQLTGWIDKGVSAIGSWFGGDDDAPDMAAQQRFPTAGQPLDLGNSVRPLMQSSHSEQVIRQENTVRIIAPEGMRLEGEGQGRGLDVRGDVAEAGVLNAGAI